MQEREIKRFYKSKEWQEKRERVLQRDRHECQDCIERLKTARAKGIRLNGNDREIRRANEVHHIKELKEFPELRLDDDNLISLCKP